MVQGVRGNESPSPSTFHDSQSSAGRTSSSAADSFDHEMSSQQGHESGGSGAGHAEAAPGSTYSGGSVPSGHDGDNHSTFSSSSYNQVNDALNSYHSTGSPETGSVHDGSGGTSAGSSQATVGHASETSDGAHSGSGSLGNGSLGNGALGNGAPNATYIASQPGSGTHASPSAAGDEMASPTSGQASGAGSAIQNALGSVGSQHDHAAFDQASQMEQGQAGLSSGSTNANAHESAGGQPQPSRLEQWAERNKPFGDALDKALKPIMVPFTAVAGMTAIAGAGLAINHYTSGGA